MFSIATVPGLVVKRVGTGEPLASDTLPSSLRLSPKTTTLLNSVAAALVLINKATVMAPARWRIRMGQTPEGMLEKCYGNA